MQHSLRSFTFFLKERKRTLGSFWFHKSYKNCKSRKNKNVKECSVLFIRLKKNLMFFFQYIFIYINWKKNGTFCVLLQKNETFSRSFTFFAKERCVLCVLLRSLQKNVAFFAFFYVLKKRTQKNTSFFWVS